ncbi:MAG TPA: SH3 domain-containing protein [Candidatus Enterenecus merdae]|nr:SH3 domain-containing protein [Candidatus Enterenecus merdae]
MPRRSNLDGLLHCDACGEDYSATYKRCPFCGQPPQAAYPAQEPPHDVLDMDSEDDGYVFDGQGAFDEEPFPVRPPRPKGGKRLASGGAHRAGAPSRSAPGRRAAAPAPSSSPDEPPERRAPEPINWPRLITFLCSLVIIAAALVIVFTVIYPQLRQNSGTAASSEPGSSQQPSSGLASLSLNTAQLTLSSGGSYQLILSVLPTDWAGVAVWSSSNDQLAIVDSTGRVTNVNQSASSGQAVITVEAGGLTTQCVVICQGTVVVASDPPAATTPVVTQPPAVTQPPVITTPAPSGLTPGSAAVVVNADSGLRVRSGPGTTYDILASLLNGNRVTVSADAGGGWYEITFSGPGGETTTGYVLGEYLSPA